MVNKFKKRKQPSNEELNKQCLEKIEKISSNNRKGMDDIIAEYGIQRVEYVVKNDILKMKYKGVSIDASED